VFASGRLSAALCHLNPATIDFRLFVVCLFLRKLLGAQIMSCMCVYRGLEQKCKYSVIHLILLGFYPSPEREREREKERDRKRERGGGLLVKSAAGGPKIPFNQKQNHLPQHAG